MQTADKQGLYDQLVDLPATLTGEILNGQLHAQPWPAPKHLHATSHLDSQQGPRDQDAAICPLWRLLRLAGRSGGPYARGLRTSGSRLERFEPPTAWFVARLHYFTGIINQSLTVLAHPNP